MPLASIYAAYLAGVGVNAIVPARGGDAVKLYLAHRAVPGSTYTTLASTLLVLSLFDTVAGPADLRLRAHARRAARRRTSLGRLPGFDFGFFVGQPRVLGRAPRRARDLRRRRLLLGPPAHRRVQGSASGRASPSCATGPSTCARSRSGRPATGRCASSRSGSSSARSTSTRDLRNVLLVQVTQSLATLVPISPGGIGTEQAFIVFVFKGAGRARRCSRSRSA